MLDLFLKTTTKASYYPVATATTTANTGGALFSLVWTIVAAILAVVGGFIIYFMFVKAKNDPKNKFLAWAKEFLDFKKMLIENILKIFFIINALFITIGSISLFGTIGVMGLLVVPLVIIFGNILNRLLYEGALITIMIWKNTSEINKKMK